MQNRKQGLLSLGAALAAIITYSHLQSNQPTETSQKSPDPSQTEATQETPEAESSEQSQQTQSKPLSQIVTEPESQTHIVPVSGTIFLEIQTLGEHGEYKKALDTAEEHGLLDLQIRYQMYDRFCGVGGAAIFAKKHNLEHIFEQQLLRFLEDVKQGNISPEGFPRDAKEKEGLLFLSLKRLAEKYESQFSLNIILKNASSARKPHVGFGDFEHQRYGEALLIGTAADLADRLNTPAQADELATKHLNLMFEIGKLSEAVPMFQKYSKRLDPAFVEEYKEKAIAALSEAMFKEQYGTVAFIAKHLDMPDFYKATCEKAADSFSSDGNFEYACFYAKEAGLEEKAEEYFVRSTGIFLRDKNYETIVRKGERYGFEHKAQDIIDDTFETAMEKKDHEIVAEIYFSRKQKLEAQLYLHKVIPKLKDLGNNVDARYLFDAFYIRSIPGHLSLSDEQRDSLFDSL